MLKNKNLRFLIFIFIISLIAMAFQLVIVLASPASTVSQQRVEALIQTTPTEIKEAITRKVPVCEESFINSLKLIAGQFYLDLNELIKAPTYNSVLIDSFKESYLKAKSLMDLTLQYRIDAIEELTAAKASGDSTGYQAQFEALTVCQNVHQEFTQEIKHIYQSTLTKSLQAKKGTVFLEKYDQINEQFKKLLDVAIEASSQLNKINDNLVCYASECS